MLISLIIGLFTTFALSADVPMITKDELKAMLGKPDLVLVDVRLRRDYMFSDFKIKGADRASDAIMGPGLKWGHIPSSELPNDKIRPLFFIALHQMKKQVFQLPVYL